MNLDKKTVLSKIHQYFYKQGKEKELYLSCDLETTNVKGNNKIKSWIICFFKKKLPTNLFKNIECDIEEIKIKNYEIIVIKGVAGHSFLKVIKKIPYTMKPYFVNGSRFDLWFFRRVLYEQGYNDNEYFDINNYLISKPHFSNKKTDFIIDFKKMKNNQSDYLIFDYRYQCLKNMKKFKKSETQKIINYLCKNWNNSILKNEFSPLINDSRKIYTIKIKNEKNQNIQFVDLKLIFPASVENMGKDVSKQEGIKLFKLDSDYDSKTYKSVKDFKENYRKEFDYLTNDGIIPLLKIKHYTKIIHHNDWKLTAGATAIHLFHKEFALYIYTRYYHILDFSEVKIGRDKEPIYHVSFNIDKLALAMINDKMLAQCFKKIPKKPINLTTFAKIFYSRLFPLKWQDKSVTDYLNIDGITNLNGFQSLKLAKEWKKTNFKLTLHIFITLLFGKGGLDVCNENYRGILTENVKSVDIISAYTSILNSKIYKCPYGEPIFGVHYNKDYDYGFYEITIKKKFGNKKVLPIFRSYLDQKTSYLNHFEMGDILYLQEPEYRFLLEFHKPHPSWIIVKRLMSFKSLPFYDFAGTFTDKMFTLKEKAKTKSERNGYKLSPNNFFGKQLSKTLMISLRGEDLRRVIEQTNSKFYTPMGCAISCYIRVFLARSVGLFYKNVLLTATDSIKYVNYLPLEDNMKKPDDEILQYLGKWDLEIKDAHCLIRRAKQYLIKNFKTNEMKYAYAGINFEKEYEHIYQEKYEGSNEQKIKFFKMMTFKNFFLGKKIENQTQARNDDILENGVIIQTGYKNLNPIWKYDLIRNQVRYRKEDFMKFYYLIKELKYESD